jgi:hypothetical protein
LFHLSYSYGCDNGHKENDMIFQYTLNDILQANKTQTRRIIKENETTIRSRHNQIQSVLINGRTKWYVGGTYAVQAGRGQPEIARIEVKQIRSEYVARISSIDALAEGFASRQEFLKTWLEIHGVDGLKARVWVLSFELVKYTDDKENSLIKELFAYASQRFDYSGAGLPRTP